MIKPDPLPMARTAAFNPFQAAATQRAASDAIDRIDNDATATMPLKIAIAIATAGRRELLAETIGFMARQSMPAHELLVCPARDDDLDPACLAGFPCPTRIVSSPIGSSTQRNAILEVTDADVVVFFDDDFLPGEDYLHEVDRLFREQPGVVVATGDVLADGILGPGLSYDEGLAVLAAAEPNSGPSLLSPTFNGYGCNMAVRMAPVRAHGIRFDEHLPLYAWLEDVDFSRQLAHYGDIVKATRLRGVHLGTKRSGRSPGKRLGYSQVANRIYIMRKGNMSPSQAFEGNFRNVAANLVRSLRPEPWVDRRGRLAGNMLALWDWLCGRVDPERILRFK